MCNSDYKIYMKILVNRISPFLNKLIVKEQSACVPGRSIFSSIRTTLDFLNYLNEAGNEIIL